MTIFLVVLAPLNALFGWAIVFDLKRRRHRAVLTSHDIGPASRRAQANADAGSGVGPTPVAGAASNKVKTARSTLHVFVAPQWLNPRSYHGSLPAGGEPGFDGEPAAARWKSTRAAGMLSRSVRNASGRDITGQCRSLPTSCHCVSSPSNLYR